MEIVPQVKGHDEEGDDVGVESCGLEKECPNVPKTPPV